MTRLKDVLPPFQSFLSQEERDQLAAMPKEKRQEFLRALALSALIRDQASTMNRAANSL
jgi:hypothetical protein